MDSFNCSGVWLRMTTISASAPARSKARAESNSQFVPGNTGMRTFGFAPKDALRGLACWSWMYATASPTPFGACIGKISFSGASYAACTSLRDTDWSSNSIIGAAWVTPITFTFGNSKRWLTAVISTSTMKEPRAGWKIARSAYLLNLTPILLPRAIFVIASGIPPWSTT